MAQTTIQALRLNPRLCPSHCHTLSTLHNVPSLGCSPVFTPGFRFVKVSDHHIQSTDGHMHGCASAEVTIITGLGVVLDALGMRSSHYGNKRGACATREMLSLVVWLKSIFVVKLYGFCLSIACVVRPPHGEQYHLHTKPGYWGRDS